MDGSIDWDALFVPSMHVGEIVLRGTAVYLFLFFLLRILRREAGHIGISDMVVVLIADAAQNAMASEYTSLTEGATLVATIAFWDDFLDWLSFRVRAVRRLLRLILIADRRAKAESVTGKDPGRGPDRAVARKMDPQWPMWRRAISNRMGRSA